MSESLVFHLYLLVLVWYRQQNCNALASYSPVSVGQRTAYKGCILTMRMWTLNGTLVLVHLPLSVGLRLTFHDGNGCWALATVGANPSATAARLTSSTFEFSFIGLASRSFERLRFVVAGSVAGGFRSVLQTLQRIVERKTAGLLARREFFERG